MVLIYIEITKFLFAAWGRAFSGMKIDAFVKSTDLQFFIIPVKA
jgi:hypothetical protein